MKASGQGRNILMELAWDGTLFKGWQRLPGAQRTVQETVEACLSTLLSEEINVIGSGRTDAGVHAEAQAANFHTASGIPLRDLGEALNAALPPDLACVSLREALPAFHARYRALDKTYAYRLADGPDFPLARRTSLHQARKLDDRALRLACAAFVGRHRFRAFTNAKKDALDYVRTVTDARVERSGAFADLVFTADGFLYNQARLMAAAALAVATGKLAPHAIAALLDSGDRAAAPGALGAYGLRIVSVSYRGEDFLGPAARFGPPGAPSGTSFGLPFRRRE